jgi:hypothetical protein
LQGILEGSPVFLAALAFPFRVGKATEALGEKGAVGIGLTAGEKAYWGFATKASNRFVFA